MWNDARAAAVFSLIWLLLVITGFVLGAKPVSRWLGRRAGAAAGLAAVLLVAGVVRLLPALLLPVGAGYDIDSFRLVTDALLGGQEVYTASIGRHPYLPFQMYIMGAMARLADGTGLPYVAAIKLPAVLADVALTGMVYYAFRRKASPDALYAALLYALNPVSLLVTSYHGQFESVTLVFLAAALLLWDPGGRGRLSAVALGLAILNKTWPVVFLPTMVWRVGGWPKRAVYAAIALGIPVISVLAYLVIFAADPEPMLQRALTHRGVAGYWGPGAVISPLAQLVPALQPVMDALVAGRNGLLAAAVLLALWWTRRQSTLDAFLTLVLSIFVVTVGFGIQWLVWPIPFAILAREYRWLKLYSLAGVWMLFVHLFGLHMGPWLFEWLPSVSPDWFIRLSALPAWLVVLLWTIRRLRRRD